MTETAKFGLTLLEAAQAQKHVTVNEALARLDALAAGEVAAVGATEPPAEPVEGAVYALGAGASGDWAGRDGELAIALAGGWAFAPPREGARVWNAATGSWWARVAGAWVEGVAAASPGGAAMFARVAETDHVLAAGTVSAAAGLIPDKAIVLGIGARLRAAITGTSAWSLGVTGFPTRYGTGFPTALGAYAEGVTGQPQAYYGGTDVLLTAEGGAFTGGEVRLSVLYLSISAPV